RVGGVREGGEADVDAGVAAAHDLSSSEDLGVLTRQDDAHLDLVGVGRVGGSPEHSTDADVAASLLVGLAVDGAASEEAKRHARRVSAVLRPLEGKTGLFHGDLHAGRKLTWRADEQGRYVSDDPRRRGVRTHPGPEDPGSIARKARRMRTPPSSARCAVASTSACERAPPSPAAALVTQLRHATRAPMCTAAMTSGTVLMPTASAPSVRSMRISAGVSYDGPAIIAYTPSCSGTPA